MASFFQVQMPTTSSIFSAYASLAAIAMLLRSFIPQRVQDRLIDLFLRLIKPRTNKLTLVIEEANATGIGRNQVYDSAELYLPTKITTPSTERLKISKTPNDKALTFRFDNGQKINDIFDGIDLKWRYKCEESPGDYPTSRKERKFFELTLDKEHKDQVIKNYIPYILNMSKSLKTENRTLKLCTLGSRVFHDNAHWNTTNFDHPSTFDTLAMEPSVKSAIKADLDRFVGRKEYYKRVGRAWKRGYLLYGPPGTGKSSLIAAMANYLRFDVYDLQLGNSISDSDLRMLLLDIANQSILVIEDIDCSVDIMNRADKDGSSDDDGKNHKPENQVRLMIYVNAGYFNFEFIDKSIM